MGLIFKCEIPGRVAIKKNGKKLWKVGNRTVPVSSDRYIGWENKAVVYILRAARELGIKGVYGGEIRAEFEFYFKNKASLPDTSNCIEGPQDAMQRARIFKDDKQIVELSAKRFVGFEPKAVVKLYSFGGSDE